MSFARSPSALTSEHLFYAETLVYVEGYTDIPFYETVLRNHNCRIKARNGKQECEKLATALLQRNYPYVVILDWDYEVLQRTRSKHRRIVLLHRHSFENYLFEDEPIQQFCRYRRPTINFENLESRFRELVDKIELKLKRLIILDVAHQCSKTGCKVLPDTPERFFKPRMSLDFQDEKIAELCTESTKVIDKQCFEDARVLVEEYLEQHRLVDLLPGHFAFAIITRLIIKTVRRSVFKQDIKVQLSTSVWDLVNTADHARLKRRLRRAVRNAQKMPKSGKGISRADRKSSD